MRIAAGEVLALMYETAREADEEFQGDQNGLCDLLKELATDSDKHKAKKDLRQQRSSFRDVMRAIEVILNRQIEFMSEGTLVQVSHTNSKLFCSYRFHQSVAF